MQVIVTNNNDNKKKKKKRRKEEAEERGLDPQETQNVADMGVCNMCTQFFFSEKKTMASPKDPNYRTLPHLFPETIFIIFN